MTVLPEQSYRYAHALVVGASGGIGAAIATHLVREEIAARVTGWSRRPGPPELDAHAYVDITDEESIAAAARTLGEVDLVIVATGLLHRASGPGTAVLAPEKTFRALAPAAMAEMLAVQVIGPALVAKHTLPLLPRGQRAVFAALSARVGSISDNRLGGWYSYRAGKAALNQVIRTLAIELQRTHPRAVCVGLHPGTVATRLSSPFGGAVDPGKLFRPEVAARHLVQVIDELHSAQSGRVWDWAGKEVPP